MNPTYNAAEIEGAAQEAPTHGRHLIDNERFPASKVVVIPNGVDTERFAPRSPSATLRRELNLSPTTPVATIVAALRPEKNHELFLRVAATVRQSVSDAKFLVVGDGPRRRDLEARANELGIRDAVQFLGTRSDIPAILNLTDVNVLTSHNEANPVSILEAMSTSTPTVATDVGSVSESVIDGRTGFLAAAGEDCKIAERVIDLINNPLLRKAFGDEARAMVLERWSLDVMVDGYQELLTRLYERNSGEQCSLPSKNQPPAEKLEPVAM